MKIPQIKTNKPVQLSLPFPKKKPQQVQLTFRFPKVKEGKLDKLV